MRPHVTEQASKQSQSLLHTLERRHIKTLLCLLPPPSAGGKVIISCGKLLAACLGTGMKGLVLSLSEGHLPQ